MTERPVSCGCEEEECVCHFYHYDCACQDCPDCADNCFCYEEIEGLTEEPMTLMEIFDQHPELLGERLDNVLIDPFNDDEVFECDLENPDICDSCQ
jgi:hypothetical protein